MSQTKRKKKFQNTRLFKILKIALLILIIFIIVNIVSDLFHKKNKNVVLIIGERKINPKNEILVEDREYISFKRRYINLV